MKHMKRLAGLLLVLAMAACDVRGRTVLIVGDSNTSMNAEAWVSYLFGGSGATGWYMPAPAFLPTFAAVPGSSFGHADWIPTLQYIDEAQEFDAVVMALGLNDSMASGCTPDIGGKIAAFIAALPEDIPIVLVDVEYVPSTGYSFACEVQVNLALQAATNASNGRIHYVNVNNVLNVMPANQRYRADGVHITTAAAYNVVEAVRVELENLL